MQTDFTLEPGATPLEIARKRKLAEALMREATDTSPVRHWTQGAARLAQALRGVQEDWSADKDQRSYDAYDKSQRDMLTGGGTSPLVGALAGPSAPDYDKAISGIESGGNYAALGPVTSKGDRAYGKHQVMGANIPSWTEAAIGKSLTPDQYLADPKAQDAVFKHRFGQYVQQTGNPQDAASMWFTGKPLAKAGNVRDQLGTTAPAYVEKFTKALGGQQGQATMVGGDDLGQRGPTQAQLMSIATNPNVSPQTRKLAEMKYLEAQKNTGPEAELRRLNILKAQQELGRPAPDNRPSAIREYEMAQKDPEFAKYQLEQRRAAAIRNEGAIPPGYKAVRDDQGNIVQLEQIPGSKEAQAATKAAAADAAKKRGEVAKSNNVLAAIDDIEKNIKEAWLPTTGFGGSKLSNTGGTAANNVRALIDTVKSNLTFEALAEMRAASPTGAALGAISDGENKLLGATVASLDQSTDEAQFLKNLARVKQVFREIVDGPPKPPPGGVDPETWKLMMPEERALWP